MGEIPAEEVSRFSRFLRYWGGKDYHLFSRNCQHFVVSVVEEFGEWLGLGDLGAFMYFTQPIFPSPGWDERLDALASSALPVIGNNFFKVNSPIKLTLPKMNLLPQPSPPR